jgi:hypothetical protein
MARAGHRTKKDTLGKQPPVPPALTWIYTAYPQVARTWVSPPMGAPMAVALDFGGMCKVLDEYGVTDRSEREEIRVIWTQMFYAESKVEAEEAKRRIEEAEASKTTPLDRQRALHGMGKASRARNNEVI